MMSNYYLEDRDLLAISNLTLIPNADLSRRTSMMTRCRAAMLAIPQSPHALRRLVVLARRRGWPLLALGGGSNTIFATAEFDGIVMILPREGFGEMEISEERIVRVGAAAELSDAVKFANRNHLMGLEFCTMIPGTVGGALAGNAGAGNYGLCDFAERVLVLTRDGEFVDLHRGDFRYSYRVSELADAIVLETELLLEPLDHETRRQRVKEYNSKKKCQPYGVPSSGCIFKNPKDPATGKPVSAGKLIDEAGLKGYRLNSVVVSEQHANFLINRGEASGEDFLAMISLVQDVVAERFGVVLEIEARIVGGPLTSCKLG